MTRPAPGSGSVLARGRVAVVPAGPSSLDTPPSAALAAPPESPKVYSFFPYLFLSPWLSGSCLLRGSTGSEKEYFKNFP